MDMKVHKALGSETRLHILKELKEKPLTYTHLMKKLGMDIGRDRGKFTYHLNILKDSGLIKQEGDTELLSKVRRRFLRLKKGLKSPSIDR